MSDYPYACEGECDPCIGNVRRVQVVDPETRRDWGFFHYCDTAVMEDMRKGFDVNDAPPPCTQQATNQTERE